MSRKITGIAKTSRRVLALWATAASILFTAMSQAQEDLSAHWNGVWNAEGTLFTIAVEVTDNVMHVTKIETMGFEWSNQPGVVDGNVVTVAVEYAGVSGTIQAELIDADTAIAFAATCLPDYMVICALAKDRQAIFRRVSSP